MRKLDEQEKQEYRRCFRRCLVKDTASWTSGAGKGGRSRWALKNLPPIDPDDPWSTELTLEGE